MQECSDTERSPERVYETGHVRVINQYMSTEPSGKPKQVTKEFSGKANKPTDILGMSVTYPERSPGPD